LERAERVIQETRGWLEDRSVTVTQRTKEEAHDYRYFPEPDLPPLFVDAAWLSALAARLPELPDARAARYRSELGLGAYDAEQLSTDLAFARLFEDTVAAGADPKKAANWIQNDVSRLGSNGQLSARHLAELIALVDQGSVGSSAARQQVLPGVHRSGKSPATLVHELGLAQVSDSSELESAVRNAIDSNPAAAADYRAGKTSAINFLKGQVMKATRGKANPAVAEELLRSHLNR
jgi:aspartyl-tRNA(Asn)/glutamyl-tRNA(Gln) amidotransferase subunit B